MVNIKHFWPNEEEVPEFGKTALSTMLEMRDITSHGFYELERVKGHFPQEVSLALPDTQDYVRLLGFRFLEEIAESMDSHDEDHKSEELIDALNYLLNIGLIDQTYIFKPELVEIMFRSVYFGRHVLRDNVDEILISIAGRLADTLRNRSWMNNAQDVMWSGKSVFLEAFEACWMLITSEFDTWAEFWAYYYAKDRVLQFRLETKY